MTAIAWICAAVAALWIAEVAVFVVSYRRLGRARP
jgi:hypothetical protein